MIGVVFITVLQFIWPMIAKRFDRLHNSPPGLVAYARWRPCFYKWLAVLAPVMIVLIYKHYDEGDAISLFIAYLVCLPMMLNHWLKAVWFDDKGLRCQSLWQGVIKRRWEDIVEVIYLEKNKSYRVRFIDDITVNLPEDMLGIDSLVAKIRALNIAIGER